MPVNRRVFIRNTMALAAGVQMVPRLGRQVVAAGTGPDWLAAQRERGRHIQEMVVKSLDPCYNESSGLLVIERTDYEPRIREQFSGTWASWGTPSYVMALLETGGDVWRANRIIDRICDHLVRDPGIDMYGNMRGMSEWTAAKTDNNSILFALIELAPLYLMHGDKLDGGVRRKLMDFFRISSVGVIRRRPVWFYSNIYLLTIAVTFLLARILNRPDLADLAERQWETWLRRTAENSLTEANSPNYILHQIGATLAVAEYASNEKIKEQARRAADFIMILLAANYHRQSGGLGGVSCRAYMGNALFSRGVFEMVMYYYFGLPIDESGTGAESKTFEWWKGSMIAHYPHEPCPQAKALVFDRTYPDTSVSRYGSYFGKDDDPAVVECHHYQSRDFSVASKNGVWIHYYQELPLHIIYASKDPRRSIFLHGAFQGNGNPCNTLMDTYFAQAGPQVMGFTYWEPPDWNGLRLWWSKGPPFLAEHWLYLGRADDFSKITVNGREARDGADFDERAVLFIEKKDIRFGLRSLPVPAGPQRARTRLVVDEDGELKLVITYASTSSVDALLSMPPAVFGMLVKVDKPGGALFANTFLAGLRETPIESEISPDGFWTLGAGGQLKIAGPTNPQARRKNVERRRPPIIGPLLDHPFMRIASPEEAAGWLKI